MDGRSSVGVTHVLARVPDLHWRTLEAGTQLDALDDGRALALERGEVVLRWQGRVLELRRGPAILLSHRRVEVTALGEVRAASFDPAHLDRELHGEIVAHELARLQAWREDELRKADDFFADSQATLVPGPYRFGPYRATMLVFRGDVTHVLPPGLRPIPGLRDRFLVVLSHIERCRALHPATDGREHRYLEVAAFVPCLGPSLLPGFFLPEVYPDAYMPVLLGREIYGFAKRLGRVALEPDGFDLVANGSHRLHVRWDAGDAAAPGWLDDALGLARRLARWRRPRLYLRKRIADVRAGRRARTALDQWVALPFTLETLADPVALARPRATFPDGAWSLPGRCEGGVQLTVAFSFADGRVVSSRRSARYP